MDSSRSFALLVARGLRVAGGLALCGAVAVAQQASQTAAHAKTAAAHHSAAYATHHAAASQKAASSTADPVVITVGGETIHASQFDQLFANVPPRQRAEVEARKRDIAENFAQMIAVAQAAQKAGLDKDPDFQFQLKLQRDKMLAQAEVDKLRKQSEPTDAQVKAYYDAHTSEFAGTKLRHILIADNSMPGSRSKRTPQEAEAKAKEIAAELQKGGDWTALAKANSDDPGSKDKGGELGVVANGQTVPEFESAVNKLKVGEVSAPFHTRFGYHIAQVEAHQQIPFDQVKDQLREKLLGEAMDAHIHAIEAQANIQLNDSYFPKPAPEPAPVAPKAAPTTMTMPARGAAKPAAK